MEGVDRISLLPLEIKISFLALPPPRQGCRPYVVRRLCHILGAISVSSLTLGFDALKLWGDDSSQTNGVAILMREFLARKHDGFACLDRTLIRSVTIDMYMLEVTASITIAQFFLLNAKVLNELKIAYWSGGEVVPSMIEELQKLEITSSDAKVVIFDRIKKKNCFVYE